MWFYCSFWGASIHRVRPGFSVLCCMSWGKCPAFISVSKVLMSNSLITVNSYLSSVMIRGETWKSAYTIVTEWIKIIVQILNSTAWRYDPFNYSDPFICWQGLGHCCRNLMHLSPTPRLQMSNKSLFIQMLTNSPMLHVLGILDTV